MGLYREACREEENFDGEWYMDPKCGYAKNDIAYAQLFITIVFQ